MRDLEAVREKYKALYEEEEPLCLYEFMLNEFHHAINRAIAAEKRAGELERALREVQPYIVLCPHCTDNPPPVCNGCGEKEAADIVKKALEGGPSHE